MIKADRVNKCINGAAQHVCKDCAIKHSVMTKYTGGLVLRTGECFICRKTKKVGMSKKLFGFYPHSKKEIE